MSKELIELNKRMKKQIIAGEDSEITKLREQVAAQAAVIEALRRHAENYKILCQDAGHPWHYLDAREALAIPTDSTQILAEVRRAERERCAKVCEEKYLDRAKTGHIREASTARALAAAIRAME